MNRAAGVIRTPDQRLRVFVSSTLGELAPERRVIRRVIERLALAPVMFELGARPHPPRSLYRAYLAQSDIFIGVYWESYGWVAPGEEVSGLEDEYNLAPDVPALVYIKRSENRQERLERLLTRIREDDRVSYVTFEDAEELETLVTADLATLLAESFDDARKSHAEASLPADPVASEVIAPPTPLTRLLGRERELHRCLEMLTTEGKRLVTLTGPGGIGKTRLAIAAAREADAAFPDGVVFVDLAPIKDPSLVVSAIATALGVRDTGGIPLLTRVAHALDHRRVLLVLDNVEQVVDAAGDVSALLDASSVVMLATSRTLLRMEGEQVLPLSPLPSEAAVELFAERARAIKPDFELTERNVGDVARVAAALDHVPLALELAAARIRVLAPAVMVQRLDHALPLLVGGARDHPDRQRTLRATIEWSADLLGDAERELFLRLGVFRSGFELDAVEWMCEDLAGSEPVELLAALIDSSLVHEGGGGRNSYRMLATVQEYARDELQQRGELDRYRQRHAKFYSDLAVRAEPELISTRQAAWITRLREEFEDIRAAVDYYLETRQLDEVVGIIWPLYWFWWITGRVPDIFSWMTAVDQAADEVDARTRRISDFYRAAGGIWIAPDPGRIPDLEALRDSFIQEGDTFGELFARSSTALLQLMQTPPDLEGAERNLVRAEQIGEERQSPFLVAMAILLRGRVALIAGSMSTAAALFQQGLSTARTSGDVVMQAAALSELGWTHLFTGDPTAARDCFVEHLMISTSLAHDEGVAAGLEAFFALAAMAGDVHRAGRLLGAAEEIRARRGITGPTVFSVHQKILADLQASPASDALDAARREGREAETADIVAEALS